MTRPANLDWKTCESRVATRLDNVLFADGDNSPVKAGGVNIFRGTCCVNGTAERLRSERLQLLLHESGSTFGHRIRTAPRRNRT
ncbi:MAG: hypothetical protein HWE39_07055 [Oceanospirillaceae bacterium]|nr:hypothetical protein [Oceanospirillaceae bacterium]